MISLNNRTMSRLADALAPRIAERLASRPRPSDLRGDPEELVTETIAAALLGMQPSTLTAWRSRGHGPAFLRLGRKRRATIRYKRGIVIEYRDARETDPESKP